MKREPCGPWGVRLSFSALLALSFIIYPSIGISGSVIDIDGSNSHITGIVTWPAHSTVNIHADVTVEGVLNIEAGTSVTVDTQRGITVTSGTLNVTGTDAEPVLFIADNANLGWEGIALGVGSDASHLTHATLEGGHVFVLRIQSSSPLIENCMIQNTALALNSGNPASADVQYLAGGAGVLIESGSPTIEGCTIRLVQPTSSGSTPTAADGMNAYGIYLDGEPNALLLRNSIEQIQGASGGRGVNGVDGADGSKGASPVLGKGGNGGQGGPGTNGGSAGAGGEAVGISAPSKAATVILGNVIRMIKGGDGGIGGAGGIGGRGGAGGTGSAAPLLGTGYQGGDGGDSGPDGNGGDGGDGGPAAGIQLRGERISSTTRTLVHQNLIEGVKGGRGGSGGGDPQIVIVPNGGHGGDGGPGSGLLGKGGPGGDGGHGGNGGDGGSGGAGGGAWGVFAHMDDGTALEVKQNTVASIEAGASGSGSGGVLAGSGGFRGFGGAGSLGGTDGADGSDGAQGTPGAHGLMGPLGASTGAEFNLDTAGAAVIFRNNIVAFGGATAAAALVANSFGGSIDHDYNLYFGYVAAFIGLMANPHELMADPLFFDAAAGDYRLAPGSPAIDAGSNSDIPPDLALDLLGQPRVVDGAGDPAAIVDLGAFETPGKNAAKDWILYR